MHRLINEFQPGETVEDQVFLVASKDLRTTSNGSLYIHAVLTDRSGQMLARVWQANEGMYKLLPEGGFIRLKGRVESYKGSLQFIIDAIRPVDESHPVDPADFMPHTSGNIEEMWARVQEIIGGIKNEDVAAIIGAFLADEELIRRFKKAPAAMQMHHAYIGGLLEHTLALLELAVVVIPRYPKVSLDLVLAGLFLHDIAKTSELVYETNFKYSDAGQLVGHVVQGTIWIEAKCLVAAEKLGRPIPADVKQLLQHLVLSHHGKLEFGAARLPATAEAIAMHHLDNLDAKIHQMLAAIEGDNDEDSNWTSYSRALETRVYKPDVLGDRTE